MPDRLTHPVVPIVIMSFVVTVVVFMFCSLTLVFVFLTLLLLLNIMCLIEEGIFEKASQMLPNRELKKDCLVAFHSLKNRFSYILYQIKCLSLRRSNLHGGVEFLELRHDEWHGNSDKWETYQSQYGAYNLPECGCRNHVSVANCCDCYLQNTQKNLGYTLCRSYELRET